MLTAFRNVFIAGVLAVGSILIAAAGQRLLELAAPAFSRRVVGLTNVSSYVGERLIFVSFFFGAFRLSTWVRSRFPVAWLLSPIVVAYLAAAVMAPDVYARAPGSNPDRWFVLSPFLVAALAVCIGVAFWHAKQSRHVV